jgi:hypothetical protein
MMTRAVAVLLGVVGLSVSAHGQAVMRVLISTDGGANWTSSAFRGAGTHVDVMITVSYTGSSSSIAGFGSANFQPVISGWDNTGAGASIDHLSAIGQGGNTLGSMINPQSNSSGLGSPNPYLMPTPGGAGGVSVPAGPYTGTYGRVYPMGRTFLDGANALTGFIHVNPPADQTGRSYAPGTYMRIAQANTPDWFNAVTNNSGGSGVNCAQLFAVGRTTSDPDFWGNQDLSYDPGDPPNGVTPSYTPFANGHNERRQNVQLFRFGIDLSTDAQSQNMVIDVPLAGQQVSSGTTRYIGFYTDSSGQTSPASQVAFGSGATQASVVPAVLMIPSPGTVMIAGLGVLGGFGRRRRRA